MPEISWETLKEWFGFLEPDAEKEPASKSVGKIKAPKGKPWWAKFKGELSTLDLKALLADNLGRCLDPDKHQWSVRCPWCQEHADQGRDWTPNSTDTVVFNPPNQVPGFKCLHAHCDGRNIAALLDHLELNNPGCVDAACGQMRIWEQGQTDKDGRHRTILPGIDRPSSAFAIEVGEVLAPTKEWFLKNDNVVVVGSRSVANGAQTLAFHTMQPTTAITSIEDHIDTGILQKEQQSEDTVFRSLSMEPRNSQHLACLTAV